MSNQLRIMIDLSEFTFALDQSEDFQMCGMTPLHSRTPLEGSRLWKVAFDSHYSHLY